LPDNLIANISPVKTTPSKIIEVITEAETRIRKAGLDETPRLDAEVMLSDLLDLGRAQLIAAYNDELDEKCGAEYSARIERRLQGEPVAYITSKKEFMGCVFHVDSRALVPRPETETLVEHVVGLIKSGDCDGRIIADIGAGSGCIAISLALLLPDTRVHATDASRDALELTRKNAELHGVTDRIVVHEGNACSALPDSLRSSIDVIVSNPPYISDADYLALDRGIREFEPSMALKGGPDGLDVFRLIAAEAGNFLKSGGFLAIEIGYDQAEGATAILQETGSFTPPKIIPDLAAHLRVITATKSGPLPQIAPISMRL